MQRGKQLAIEEAGLGALLEHICLLVHHPNVVPQ